MGRHRFGSVGTKTIRRGNKVSIQEVQARAFVAAKEHIEFLGIVKNYVIESDDDFVDAAEFLKQVKHKWKVLDEERKGSVTPLNDEVKKINGWFKPALDALAEMEKNLKNMIAAFEMKKREEQTRLMEEASRAALTAATSITTTSTPEQEVAANAEVMRLVQEANAAERVKVAGISTRSVTRWEIADWDKVPFELCSPDPKKIAAFIEAHPEWPLKAFVGVGLRVWQDVVVAARS